MLSNAFVHVVPLVEYLIEQLVSTPTAIIKFGFVSEIAGVPSADIITAFPAASVDR